MTAATWVMTAFGVMWFFWSTFRTLLSTVRWKESNSAWYAFHTLSLIIWVFYNLFRVLLNIVVYIHPLCRKGQHLHTHHKWILGTPESPYRSNISENTLYRDLDLGPLHIGLMNMMKNYLFGVSLQIWSFRIQQFHQPITIRQQSLSLSISLFFQ